MKSRMKPEKQNSALVLGADGLSDSEVPVFDAYERQLYKKPQLLKVFDALTQDFYLQPRPRF